MTSLYVVSIAYELTVSVLLVIDASATCPAKRTI